MHSDHFARLEQQLKLGAEFWRASPYRGEPLAWREHHPALVAALQALKDDEVETLGNDSAALLGWLEARVPALRGLRDTLQIPPARTTLLAPDDPHRTRDVPGRKLAQIRAFLATVGVPQGPVLDWCAGKGHLGRLVCLHHPIAATSLEIDPQLCRTGGELAQRHRVPLHDFLNTDVLAPATQARLAGHHALALHACGELHRALVRGVIATAAPALDLAPCCYHRGSAETHDPLNPIATLRLHRDDLRLAVSDSVTAAPREIRERRRELAWRLAGQTWLTTLGRAQAGDPLPRPPKAWFRLEFADYLDRLSASTGARRALPHCDELAREGWRREAELRRLALPRLAFRRALELWLVLDLALALETHGYTVTIGEWCERRLTPRNLLLRARRK
ncbi:MAG: methyltransferase [Thiotrichales bacterium]